MRRFLLLFLLPQMMWAQGTRYDNYNVTSANSVPFGAQAPIYTLPNSTVTVCAYPDDGGQPCGNVIPIYSDPALTQTADNPITADVHGRFGFWLASGTYTYSVVTQGGVFLGTYIFTLGGSGAVSGCGSVAGDNSSTNCGYNNRTGDTAALPASVQTFGSNLLGNNTGLDVVAMGSFAGTGNTGSGGVFIGDSAGKSNGGDGVISIGSFAGASAAGQSNFAANSEFIGTSSGWQSPGNAHNSYLDCLGYNTCRDMQNNGSYIVGVGAFTSTGNSGNNIFGLGNAATSGHSGTEIVGIGDGAADNGRGDTASPGDNIVGIGHGSGSGPSSGSGSESVGIGDHAGFTGVGSVDTVAIGDRALSAGEVPDQTPNTGTELIAIGHGALAVNTTGSDNVAVGAFSGANGWIRSTDNGFANLTGSQNTWIGDFSGPHTATQLSNTIALGYQAYNTLSNQTVIGNPSITEAHVYGTFFTPASSSAPCTVPEFADDANFHYVCTALNTWKRVALSSF